MGNKKINFVPFILLFVMIFLTSFIPLFLKGFFPHTVVVGILCFFFAIMLLPFIIVQRFNRPRVLKLFVAEKILGLKPEDDRKVEVRGWQAGMCHSRTWCGNLFFISIFGIFQKNLVVWFLLGVAKCIAILIVQILLCNVPYFWMLLCQNLFLYLDFWFVLGKSLCNLP